MNNEIKEILDKLQKVANRETASRNALMEMENKDYQLLLDYITNLKEENKRLNNIINETLEYAKYQLENFDFYEDTKAKMFCAMIITMLNILQREDNE